MKALVAAPLLLDLLFTIPVDWAFLFMLGSAGPAEHPRALVALVLGYGIKTATWLSVLVFLVQPLRTFAAADRQRQEDRRLLAATLAAVTRLSVVAPLIVSLTWGLKPLAVTILLASSDGSYGGILPAGVLMSVALFLGAALLIAALVGVQLAPWYEHLRVALRARGKSFKDRTASMQWRLVALGIGISLAPTFWLASLAVGRYSRTTLAVAEARIQATAGELARLAAGTASIGALPEVWRTPAIDEETVELARFVAAPDGEVVHGETARSMLQQAAGLREKLAKVSRDQQTGVLSDPDSGRRLYFQRLADGSLVAAMARAPRSGLQNLPLEVGIFILVAMMFAGITAWITGALMTRPVGRMAETVRMIVERGDLTLPLPTSSDDEIGDLGEALQAFLDGQRRVLTDMRQLIAQAVGVVNRVSEASGSAVVGAETIAVQVEHASGTVRDLLDALARLAQQGRDLAESAQVSSSAVIQLETSSSEIQGSFGQLSSASDNTASSINQMMVNIKQNASNVDALESRVTHTTAAMTELEGLTRTIVDNASAAADLSSEVIQGTRGGMQSLSRTVEAMQNIADTTRTTAGANLQLSQAVERIGEILEVIEAVAKQTNLLSLNAAIISSQAGEHGRAFAVVADEIKALANQTQASTGEIANIVHEVQAESERMNAAMGSSVESAETGLRRIQETEAALATMIESLEHTLDHARDIVNMTRDQVRHARQVTESMQQATASISHLNRASQEQAQGADQIVSSTEQVKSLSLLVQRANQEQTSGVVQIAATIERARSAATAMSSAQVEEEQRGQLVQSNVKEIAQISSAQTDSLKELESAVHALMERSQALEKEIERFTV